MIDNSEFIALLKHNRITKKELGACLGKSQPTIKNLCEKPYYLSVGDIYLLHTKYKISIGKLFASSISCLYRQRNEALINTQVNEL